MNKGTEQVCQKWKRTAVVAGVVAVCSLTLAAVFTVPNRFTRMTDDRLIGTWQSDAERTISGMEVRKAADSKQEAALRNLFGKMRVTYTRSSYTTE